MQILLKGGMVYNNGRFKRSDVFISDGVIVSVSPADAVTDFSGRTIDCDRFFIVPSFADIHVHLREPGFSYKATVKSETAAAAKGGYTVVCAMPNVSPAPDSIKGLGIQLEIIKRDALIDVLPYGCITKGSLGSALSDMEDIAPFVCGFSDDGKGVQEESMITLAMETAKKLGKPISAHCEVNSLLTGGSIHDGRYAKEHGMKGISSESEWKMIERDLSLVEKTGCRYNVCHISAKESVELIRKAKKKGLPVTAETAPHYLCLSEDDLLDEGRFKMNPPLRSKEDKEALIEGFIDGTIDHLATDHAPHSKEEKEKGLEGSLFGIVGLETAFSTVHTALVKEGKMSLETLIERMSVSPRKFLGLPYEIKIGEKADITIIDPEKEWTINSQEFVSAAKSTPFDGFKAVGTVEYTIHNGEIVWERGTVKG